MGLTQCQSESLYSAIIAYMRDKRKQYREGVEIVTFTAEKSGLFLE